MNTELISLVMDIVVLVFLGATIIYVVKLSASLKAFKAHRSEFDKVISDLLSSIDTAERAVGALKQTSASEAERLGALISTSKSLADELTIINDAGEGMAKRLERLAESNREIAQQKSSGSFLSSREDNGVRSSDYGKVRSPIPDFVDPEQKKDVYASTLNKVKKPDVTDQSSPFAIRDRDFSNVESLERKLDGEVSNDKIWQDDEGDIPENLQSQAERDLLAALRGAKRSISKGD